MDSIDWNTRALHFLHDLCDRYPDRRVGSPGNKAATDLFSSTVRSNGFEVETPEFDCIDWLGEGTRLAVGESSFEVLASPYSLGCKVSAPLVVVSTLQDLEATTVAGAVLLLQGEIAKEQLMPKNFPFYNPAGHQRIIQTLEAKNPRAIVAATERDYAMVGGSYPYPLFEDGDFDIPSVYMTDLEGERLAEHAGDLVDLESRAQRVPSRGCNVIARKGPSERRVVFFAHVDSRIGSPGAGDNASGVVTLLLLSELLADHASDLGVELVAMNGEDYYANPGERQWLAANAGRFDEINLGVNLDDVGYRRGRIAYSLYNLPAEMERVVQRTLSTAEELIEGPPWYQGDHSLLLMNGVSAMAFTSELLDELMREITHTPKDRPETVDPGKLVQLAHRLRELLVALNRLVV
jgi:aminopeptidase YwaD